VSAILVQDLVKRYRGAQGNALDGISIEVREGDLFCLLGPNGAGKTTMVSILTTLLAPTSGTVRVNGHDVGRDQLAVRRSLGVVFQQPALDLNLTAEENLRFHAILYGLHPWRPNRRLMPAAYWSEVRDLAQILGLGGVLNQPARALSGGTRRKLEIVRALMHRPQILFLDEPTAGLDPESRSSLWEYLARVRSHYGTSIFLTTHYLHEAEGADAVQVMWRGRALAGGTPGQIKAELGGCELALDALDRARLRAELVRMGLNPSGEGPFRVRMDSAAAQGVIRRLRCELTLLRVTEPTLEEAYLSLIERARG